MLVCIFFVLLIRYECYFYKFNMYMRVQQNILHYVSGSKHKSIQYLSDMLR